MTKRALARFFSPRRNRAALRRLAKGIVGNRRGVAAVEFAMILPAMLAIYFGVVEVAQGVMVDRKVTQLNRALADLTAQSSSLSPTDIDAIFAAARTVMLPYTRVAPRMVISSVTINSAGRAQVCWSQQSNSVALRRGDEVTLPTDLRIANSSIIMAVATYDFEPTVGHLFTGSIPIGGTPIYMRPRIGKAGGTGNVEQVERAGASPATPMCPGY